MKGLRSVKELKQFSLRFLLGLTACCAILMAVWKIFIYEPPTHQFPAYEKASSTRSLAAKIGPNTITIASVARNDRDGSVNFETGSGKPLSGPIRQQAILAACGPWLDVVQFELQPGPQLMEIIEVRVFDHASRTLLSALDPAYGWHVAEPNVLQVYGLGKQVPPVLDVWLRLHSYEVGDQAVLLPPRAGSRASIAGGAVTLSDIQSGFAGWDSRSGFFPVDDVDVDDVDQGQTALVLQWQTGRSEQRYQAAAVSVDGEKQFYDGFLSTRFGGLEDMLLFDFALTELDHIELRPHGGSHRFFYEAVQVPPVSGGSFDPAPKATVVVNQSETQAALPELSPLPIRLSLSNGRTAGGSWASTHGIARITDRAQRADVDQSFTLTLDVKGFPRLPLAIRFQETDSGKWITESSFGRRGSWSASGAVNAVTAKTYSTPLDRVQAVEVSVGVIP